MTKSERLARVPPAYRLAHAWKDRRHQRRHALTREKHALLRETARSHGLRILVETGTYTGETSWAFRSTFDRIETIELDPSLARLARIRFGRTSSVHVHEGDSVSVLAAILESLDRPTLFWLDAHPCTDRSATDAPVPLLAELAAITAHPVAGHVVLVDDMRLMGSEGFPAREQLALPGWRLEQVGDVARLAQESQASRA
jgi:predicted O-methyltransferase YrrM